MTRIFLLSSFMLAFANIHGAFAATPAASSAESFSVPSALASFPPSAPAVFLAKGGVSTINSRVDALTALKMSCIHYLQGTEDDNETNKACGVFKLDSKALAQSPKSFDLPMSLADQKKYMQTICKIGLSFPKSKATEQDALERACKALGCNANIGPCLIPDAKTATKS